MASPVTASFLFYELPIKYPVGVACDSGDEGDESYLPKVKDEKALHQERKHTGLLNRETLRQHEAPRVLHPRPDLAHHPVHV